MEYKRSSVELKEVDEEKRIISAVVSTSDLDDGGDIIMPGAFSRTIRENQKRIKMLWQHKSDTPIGRPTFMEEMPSGGLRVDSYVSRIQKGEDFLTLAKEEIVTEFSIGFIAKEWSHDDDGIRRITDLDLMEFSPVTWGMNKNTQLIGIKSADDLTPKNIEAILREAGLSRSQAKAIACAGLRSLREADRKTSVDEELLKAVKASIHEYAQNARA